ncbi:MAG: ABC transporter substrate-binding protein [Candidatus Kariarchaeaceae archaeon]|jgi:peptide/nickel transport system substrate-binding protein
MITRGEIESHTIIVLLIISNIGYVNVSGNMNAAQLDDELREIIYLSPFYASDEYSPWNTVSYFAAQWLSAVKAGLYTRSAENDRKYILELAKNDTVSEDGLTWTVELKEGFKFSSGNPLTADDVVFSYRVALTPAIHQSPGVYSWYSNFFVSNSSITKIDEYTIQFKFDKFYTFAQSLLTLMIIEQAEFMDLYNDCISGNSTACNWDDPLGSFAKSAGPFKLKSIDNSTREITLIRNEHYFDIENVWADQIVFKSADTLTEALEQLSNDTADILAPWYSFNPTFKDQVDDNATAAYIEKAPSYTVQEMALNHFHPVFGTGENIPNGFGISDNDNLQALLVRKALSHIVSREKIVNDIMDGLAINASILLPPGIIGYDTSIPIRNYSISTARNYMEMAGYDYSSLVDDNQDGDYGDINDTTFFEVSLLVPNTNPRRNQWALDYADELPKIGIGVKTTNLNNWSVVEPRAWYYGGNPPIYDEGGYDMLFVGITWNYALEWDPGTKFIRSGFCEEDTYCYNYYNYYNATIEHLIDSYNQEFDENIRTGIFREIQWALHNNLPAIPIIYQIYPWVIANDIEGIDIYLLQNIQYEWKNIKKSDWIKITDSKDSKGSDNISQTIILGTVGAALIAVFVTIYYRKK